MSSHFRVLGKFDGCLAEKAYFVADTQMARRAALQDGAQAVYRIKQINQSWLTQPFMGKDYAMLLLRAISFQVDAGVPAVKAVQTAIESESDPHKRSRLQGAVEALARGASLADALAATGLYDTTIHSILVAGERTGGASAIAAALDHLEDRKTAWKAYGVMLSMLGMELSTALTLPPSIQSYAIPWIRENLPKSNPENLAKYTQQLDTLAFNNLVWMWISFGLLAGIAGMIVAWFANPRYKDWLTQHVLMRTPLIGDWYANDALARSCKVFASMLKAGVQMGDAIQTILKSTSNGVARKFWSAAQTSMAAGVLPGPAFASSGILRKDEVLVLGSVRGGDQIARAFAAMSSERTWRQKILGARIFRMSIVIMMVYIAITLLIGFRLFELFNAGLDMSMNSMTKGI